MWTKVFVQISQTYLKILKTYDKNTPRPIFHFTKSTINVLKHSNGNVLGKISLFLQCKNLLKSCKIFKQIVGKMNSDILCDRNMLLRNRIFLPIYHCYNCNIFKKSCVKLFLKFFVLKGNN